MKHKQFALLFICYCIPPFIGLGLFPLLPLYATRFGATRPVVGILFALMYGANLLGTLTIGWLSPRVPRKGIFLSGALLGVPAVALLGQVTALWQVMVLTALVWFCGGITLTLISVTTATATASRSRGKAFALLSLALPLGGLFGGMLTSHLVTYYSFPLMFLVLSAIWASLPIVGLLSFPAPRTAPPASAPRGADVRPDRAPPAFYLLMLSGLVVTLGISISRLSLSLSMQELGFSASAIVSTTTMSGLATIPIAVTLGTLSDRLGQRRVLRLSPLLVIGGVALLIMARQLWQFQLGASLLVLASAISGSVGAAYAAALLAPAAMGRYLPRFQAMDAVASIIGFGCAGLMMDLLGHAGVYWMGGALAALALPLLSIPTARNVARWSRPARRRYPTAQRMLSAGVVDKEVVV